jgi:hypothetical protein
MISVVLGFEFIRILLVLEPTVCLLFSVLVKDTDITVQYY